MPLAFLIWATTAFSLYFLNIAVSDLFFHSLRGIPGPRLWILFPVLKHISAIRGRFDIDILEFHARYGLAVRFGRDEVSFIAAEAWKDIYGNDQLPKVLRSDASPRGITSSNKTDHSRYRKALSHAFSSRSIRAQEPLVRGYVDKLIERLKGIAENNLPADMYNLTTFHIIGDLALGESFGGLDRTEYHRWIDAIFLFVKANPFITLKEEYPILTRFFFRAFTPTGIFEAKRQQREHSRMTVKMRLENVAQYAGCTDFMNSMLRNSGTKDELSYVELRINSNILIVAGSEPTATLLSGITYLLLRNPDTLAKVVSEVRSVMKSEADITTQKAFAELPYMLVCFDEAFRQYPPVPTGLQRWTFAPVTTISGYDIPPRTKVSVHQSAAYISRLNFHAPTCFIPERWLPEAKNNVSSPFYEDKRDVLQPFHIGPRDCIARSLAFSEMRVILARLLWNFDFELCDESVDWMRQKTYVIWEKLPLMCRMKVRQDMDQGFPCSTT